MIRFKKAFLQIRFADFTEEKTMDLSRIPTQIVRREDSVTIFGEILPLWQNILRLGQNFDGLFCIWQKK